MSAFLFVVDRLAYVVQQAGALGKVYVKPQLLSHQACKQRDLYGVPVYVLAVTCPVFQPAYELYQFGMQAEDANFEHRAFARLLYLVVELLLYLFDSLFYAGGMYSAVGYQLFKRKPGDLPPYGIESRKDDDLRGVVDYELDARRVFERADIPALPSYDPRLHVVARERYCRYRDLRRMVGGATLYGKGDYLFCFVCSFLLGSLLDVPHLQRHVVAGLVEDLVGEQRLCLVLGQLCDLFQFLNHQLVLVVDLVLGLLYLLFPCGKIVLLFFERIGFLGQRILPLVEVILPLVEALLLFVEFGLLFPALAFEIVA